MNGIGRQFLSGSRRTRQQNRGIAASHQPDHALHAVHARRLSHHAGQRFSCNVRDLRYVAGSGRLPAGDTLKELAGVGTTPLLGNRRLTGLVEHQYVYPRKAGVDGAQQVLGVEVGQLGIQQQQLALARLQFADGIGASEGLSGPNARRVKLLQDLLPNRGVGAGHNHGWIGGVKAWHCRGHVSGFTERSLEGN